MAKYQKRPSVNSRYLLQWWPKWSAHWDRICVQMGNVNYSFIS